MKQHEREYFVSRVRSGFYDIKHKESLITVLTPSIDDEFYINQAYMDSYNKSLEKGLKTEDEMIEWMMERNLWLEEDEERIKGLNKDLERLKLEIYQAANNDKLKKQIRLYLRAGERQLLEMSEKKSRYFLNTCEGIASTEKVYETLRRCAYNSSDLCNFDIIPIDVIANKYFRLMLTQTQIRELARTDPWRSIWAINDSNAFKLFNNKDRELSIDQKNILVWSRMYDNVQESLDCPPDDVIEDDDMLDGWFIHQKNKREKEKAESELENTMNEKVSNSDEVYIVANSQKDIDRINRLNNPHANMIKKQRESVIKAKGKAGQLDFQDEKLKIRSEQTKQFKDKFRR